MGADETQILIRNAGRRLTEDNEMNEAINQTPEAANASADWRERLRTMYLECAQQWQNSADYWRREAAKYVVSEDWVMASEALFNATIREEYAAADLAKANGLGVSTN